MIPPTQSVEVYVPRVNQKSSFMPYTSFTVSWDCGVFPDPRYCAAGAATLASSPACASNAAREPRYDRVYW